MAKRNSKGQFSPGSSGNPHGRPKRTEQERQIVDEMCQLAPAAMGVLKNMLTGERVPGYLRMRAAEVVIERICGKPMTAAEMDSFEDSQKLLDSMFENWPG